MFKKADDKGFTLIELLIVIAIIGQQTSANLAAAESQASSLNSLVAASLAINGTVGTLDGNAPAGGPPATVTGQAYDGGNAGSMTVTDGTLTITGTTGTTYCAASTVSGQTAEYGPGC